MTEQLLSGDDFVRHDLPDWREMQGRIEARYATGDFETGLGFVNAVAAAAASADHHPDIDLRYASVHIAVMTHSAGGLTSRDVGLARTISELAAQRSLIAVPSMLSRLEIAIDTWDIDVVRPFWAAVYGIDDPGPGNDAVTDPTDRQPTIWFQTTDEHAEPRQRFHLDLRVPPDEASGRIGAAVEAGGTVTDASAAPRFVVLADPQGNKVCVCTHVGRPPGG